MGLESRKENPTLPRGGFAASDYETLLKCRTFADPAKGYTLEELEALIASFREHKHAFGTSFVRRLLGVPKGKKRDESATGRDQGPLELRRARRRDQGGRRHVVAERSGTHGSAA